MYMPRMGMGKLLAVPEASGSVPGQRKCTFVSFGHFIPYECFSA